MTIKDSEYWKERFIRLEEASQKLNDEYIEEMAKAFDDAKNEVERTINEFLAVIAVNNSVSLQEARRLLDANELKEFKYDLKKYREVAIKAEADVSWIKKLENASAKARISRLDAINMSLEQSVQVLKAKQLRTTTDGMADIINSQYYRSIYELEKGIGFNVGFEYIDEDYIATLIKTPWAPDGSNFSARIWQDRTKLVGKLKQDLVQQLITGQDINLLTKSYQEQLGVNQYNATRLLRTESTYFANATRQKGYRETGVKKYEYLAILDNRTSEICTNLDGKIFNLSDAQAGINYPAMHVNCRSTTIPVVDFDEDEYENMFDDELSEFDDELSLTEWAEQFNVDLSPPKVPVQVSVFPPRVTT